jgi:hypothetical protein
LSVVPIKADGSKAAAVPWKPYQQRLASDDELQSWFGADPRGIAIVGGAVSGNLELLDFETESTFEQWRQLVEAQAPGLVERLNLCRTPGHVAGSGRHVRYRVSGVVIPGNCVLARDGDGKTLVETRGTGGYALAPGSPPGCHETGRTWEHVAGPDLLHLPVITAEERELLVATACCLNGYVEAADRKPETGPRAAGGLRPGDHFNVAGPDWSELLDGWKEMHRSGEVRYWQRPGKAGRGWSGTTGFCTGADGSDLFYCFSSNGPPFTMGTAYSKFRAFALLRHDGDYAAAAHAIALAGYGDRWPPVPPTTNGDGHAEAPERPAAEPKDDVPQAPPWPAPLAEEAFHGPAGEAAHLIEPATEADVAAVLFQILVGFGNQVGRGAYAVAEADRHHGNEFVVIVGKTSKARKGTSQGYVRKLLGMVDATWEQERYQSGLSSGEGVIWSVRDAIEKQKRVRKRGGPVRLEMVVDDPGVSDKRLLAYEPEFASVLKQTERQGNTLSTVLRLGWDGMDLRTMTKNSPARATGAHISLVGHITADELRRYLSTTEMANGFGNRILWVCAKRSKELPLGGKIDVAKFNELAGKMTQALGFARTAGKVGYDEAARSLWCEMYAELSKDRPGLSGALLARAEAHALRLSLLYALLDEARHIGTEHLLAAVALWDYAEASVLHIFGDSLGDPVADDILRLLRAKPDGVTRTEIMGFFGNNRSADRIGRALALLLQHGLARCQEEQTRGRPIERWFATRPKGGT